MIETGQTYRSTLDVLDENGAPANPATATYTVTLPDQTTATAPVTLPPAVLGHLVADYVTTQPGLHRGKWVTTAPGIPKTDSFSVREYRSLLSLDEARDHLGVSGTSRDETIRSLLGGVTRLIERHIGTCVIRQVAGEIIRGYTRDVLRLPSGPLPSQSAVTSIASAYPGGPSWVAADLIIDPEAATVRLASFLPFWYGPWRATYLAGRAVIPDDVLEGAKFALWDLWATQRGISADVAEQAAADELAVPPFYRLPPRVLQMIEGERLPGFA